MKGLIAWFARNSVAANLLMLLILVAGLSTISSLKLEVFPEVASQMITVSVPYLGAAPQERVASQPGVPRPFPLRAPRSLCERSR